MPFSLLPVVLSSSSALVLLTLNFVVGELSPQLSELFLVLMDVEWVVSDQDILLISLTGLDSPVERSGQEHIVIDDGESKILAVGTYLLCM